MSICIMFGRLASGNGDIVINAGIMCYCDNLQGVTMELCVVEVIVQCCYKQASIHAAHQVALTNVEYSETYK